MTICIAGKNRIAVEAMKYSLKHFPQHQVVGCCNRNDDGVDGWQPSFRRYCECNNVPLCSLEDLYPINELLFLSLEFDRIVQPAKFHTRRLFNIHFSKLPAYKGMYTSVLPLQDGAPDSGVTLHRIDAGIDTGEILEQVTFPLGVDLTARELYELYLDNGIGLFKANIDRLVRNEISSTPQPVLGSSYFSMATLDFSNVTIDLKRTAFQIHNQVRSFIFRDYQLPTVFGWPIYKSRLLGTPAAGKPGSVVFQDEWTIDINTIDYQVRLYIDQAQRLFDAAASGDIDTFNTIQEHDFPVTVRSKQGWNALIVACFHDQLEFVDYLVGQGWDINSANYKGTTALMYAMTVACKEGRDRVFRKYASQADLSNQDVYGKNIFDWAQQYANQEVIQFLEPFKQQYASIRILSEGQ